MNVIRFSGLVPEPFEFCMKFRLLSQFRSFRECLPLHDYFWLVFSLTIYHIYVEMLANS